jgi:hypothetical protein
MDSAITPAVYALSRRHIQWLQFDPLLNIFRAGVPRILIFLSRNSDSVDLCCLDRSIHISGFPAWNMSSEGLNWSH